MANRHVGNMDDTMLANYISSVNFKWIESMQELSLMSQGTMTYRTQWIRHTAIMKVYNNAVNEAISRGMLILH